MFASAGPKLMIDLGCGPGTAGLALGDCLESPRLSYLGIDRARPMLLRAKSMLQAAIESSILGPKSQIDTTTSWPKLLERAPSLTKPANVLVNATYLFASSSLNVDDVCNVVKALKKNSTVKRLLFTYSNSTIPIAGTKYDSFKRKLKNEFESDGPTECTVTFCKRWSGGTMVEAKYVRDLLVFKE